LSEGFDDTGYRQLEKRIEKELAERDDVRGAFVVGSRARQRDHAADVWADLDVIVIAAEPALYVNDSAWLADIGPVVMTFADTTPGGTPERRVMFEGGLDVDFALLSPDQAEGWAGAPEAADVFGRGFRVLVDRDDWASRISELPEPGAPPPPGEAQFLNVVYNFWYHAVWAAKHLRRGELWWAKGACDGRLKWDTLLPMLEWHARATRGEDVDTWMRGRFLEEWADPRAVKELAGAFARYDTADVARALRVTMDLFSRLTRETAAVWGYRDGAEAEGEARRWVDEILGEDRVGDGE
jgi:aminoglycoside 6-adenylyltransferase